MNNSLQVTQPRPSPSPQEPDQYVRMVEKTIAAWPKAAKSDNLALSKGTKSMVI